MKIQKEYEDWLKAYMRLHRLTRDEAIESLIDNYKAWNQKVFKL